MIMSKTSDLYPAGTLLLYESPYLESSYMLVLSSRTLHFPGGETSINYELLCDDGSITTRIFGLWFTSGIKELIFPGETVDE